MTDKILVSGCPLTSEVENFIKNFPWLYAVREQINLDFRESMASVLDAEIDSVETGTQIISAYLYCFVSAMVCTTNPQMGHTARVLLAKQNSEKFQQDIMNGGPKENVSPSGLIL